MKWLIALGIYLSATFASAQNCTQNILNSRPVSTVLDTMYEVCQDVYKANGALDLKTSLGQHVLNHYLHVIALCGGGISDMVVGTLKLPFQLGGTWLSDRQEMFCRSILDFNDVVTQWSSSKQELEELAAQGADLNAKGCRNEAEITRDRNSAIWRFITNLGSIVFDETTELVCEPDAAAANKLCPLLAGIGLTKLALMSKLELIAYLQSKGWHITHVEDQASLWTTKDYEIISGKTDGDRVYKLINRATTKEINLGFDERNGIIDMSNSVRPFFQGIVKESPSVAAGKGNVLAVIDINDLKYTNYFPDKMVSGDRYIQAVTDAIRKKVGPDAIVVKNYRGDEFFVMFKNTNAKTVQQTLSEVSGGVAQDSGARAVFNAERILRKQVYVALQQAQDVTQLPASYLEKLPTALKTQAENPATFQAFKQAALAKQKEVISNMASYKPSVSTGSVFIDPTKNLEDLIKSASDQMAEVKEAYKRAVGIDTDKYGGYGTSSDRNLHAVPEVRQPLTTVR